MDVPNKIRALCSVFTRSLRTYDEVPESTDGEIVDPKDRSAERNTRVAVRPGAVHVIAEASHVSFLLFYRGEVVIDW